MSSTCATAPAGGRTAGARGARVPRPARAALEHRAQLLAAGALLAIAGGALAHAAGDGGAGDDVWRAAVALLSAALFAEVAHTVVVHRHLGVDTIALVAMAGALALGQELAGAVVGLMFSGGAALEDRASTRARRELTALVARAPAFAQRIAGGRIERVPIAAVAPGDVVLVRTGDVVPVDGTLLSEDGLIDTSALSGESLPVALHAGAGVLSGTSNVGPPAEVRARRPAAESAYAALVRLVEQAQSERAPFVRMADRFAGFFLPVTLFAAAAAWIASGDPVRALAVVVVATPCPLILAAPIALVSGLSRAARAGVIVKGAGAIEALGGARTVLFDKTGTLTVGVPSVRETVSCGTASEAELLALAASLDQVSAHPYGEAIVRAAGDGGLALRPPGAVREQPGRGIEGVVDGRRVAVGSHAFLASAGVPAPELAGASSLGGRGSGEARALVALDGHLAGAIVMADEPRPGSDAVVERLRADGVAHVALVSGDRRSVAERVGAQLGMDRVYAECTPQEKLEIVRALRGRADRRPVVMVGDGVNDAPALALADVGIAMGAAAATVSSQTADAVIVVDRIDLVADAVHAGRRAVAIARQSVLAGMGLSLAAMAVAATGHLPPLAGALLQEGIDLGVILNALRALRG